MRRLDAKENRMFSQVSKLGEVKDECVKVGVEDMSVSEVRSFGRQREYLEGERINKKGPLCKNKKKWG